MNDSSVSNEKFKQWSVICAEGGFIAPFNIIKTDDPNYVILQHGEHHSNADGKVFSKVHPFYVDIEIHFKSSMGGLLCTFRLSYQIYQCSSIRFFANYQLSESLSITQNLVCCDINALGGSFRGRIR